MTEHEPLKSAGVAAAATLDHRSGELLGDKYLLLELIGQGGQTSVWKAQHTEIERSVAVKILHWHRCDDSRSVARFMQEAKALTSLRHPHIVEIFSVGVTDKQEPYIVMELVQGESLSSLLERAGPLPPERARAIFITICQALSFAHAKGIIHRDIKPSNVMVTDDGTIKLIDFGLAKLATETAGAGQKLTQTGTVIGSCHYMSPEQASGQPCDERSDVYSLGCLMYEALSGQPAFDGDTPMAILQKQLLESPVPLQGQSTTGSVPPYLVRIIHQCLAKDPNQRQFSMAAVERQLAEGQSARRRLLPKGATLARLTACCVGLTLAGAIISVWRWLSPTETRDILPAQANTTPLVPSEAKPRTATQALRRADDLLSARTGTARNRAFPILVAGLKLCNADPVTDDDRLTLATIHMRLGNIHCERKNTKQGLEHMRTAVSWFKKLRNIYPQLYMTQTCSLASYLPPDEAHKLLKDLLAEPRSSDLDITNTYWHMAKTCMERIEPAAQGNAQRREAEIAEVELYGQKILAECKVRACVVQPAEAYLMLAECQAHRAEASLSKTEAAKHRQQAFAYLANIFDGSPDYSIDWRAKLYAARRLALLYESAGDIDAANEAYQRIYRVPDYCREKSLHDTLHVLESYLEFLQRHKLPSQKVQSDLAEYKFMAAR